VEGHSELLAVYPLLYVVWADAELSAEELALVRERTAGWSWLSDAGRAELASWLDPDSPPSPQRLRGLLDTIRERAADLSEDARHTLVDLGEAVAAGSEGETDEEARRALMDLEEALGVSGAEAARELLRGEDHRPEQEDEWEDEPSFDVDQVRALLDGKSAAARDEMRELIARPLVEYDYELDKETQRARVLEQLGIVAAAGWGRRAYPGVTTDEPDLRSLIAGFETLACADLGLLVKFGVQFGLFGGSVYFLGTEKHHDLLSDIASLELPGCFAMTELGHGSNVYDLETTAIYDPETREIEINTPSELARKEWIGNAALHGRMATVFAQLEVDGQRHGVHAFLVPLREKDGTLCEGVRIEDCGHKMGLNGIDNGRIWFDHVRVPIDYMLDRFAQIDEQGVYQSAIPSPAKRFFTMLGTLVAGRVSVAVAALSAAKVGLSIAIRYSARRRQFGAPGEPESPIIEYRAQQHKLLPKLATAYALSLASHYVIDRYLSRTEEDSREVEALVAGFKGYATWFATDALQACREACGGQGYLSVNRLASLKADSDVFTTFEGDNTVLMQLVAKSLLTEYRQQFSESRVFSVLKLVLERATTAVVEKNPIAIRRAGVEHLRSREFHLAAFRCREDELLLSAAQRIKKRIDGGMDSFEAFTDCQPHLIDLAKAHVERVLLEQFVAVVDACDDDDIVDVLDRMCDLFALSSLERDREWFLSNDYIEGSKAKSIRRLVTELCADVVEDAVGLVDAFGIPDVCLAPIARNVDPRN
jgi:acyl-CoA oxidase